MRNIKENDIVCHFKRDLLDKAELDIEPNKYLYEIVCFAYDSEDMSELVVYRALYGDKKVFVRKKEEFFGKTDKSKYPNALREYRFELYK